MFIDLTRDLDDHGILVNPKYIVVLIPRDKGCTVVLVNSSVDVTEDETVVMAKIEDLSKR